MPPKIRYQEAKGPKIREVFDKNPIACDKVRSGRWYWSTELGKCVSAEEHYANKVTKHTTGINTGEWVKGWYEHIDSKPIYIESKKQLAAECEKRGLYARSLMQPKSQGEGYEHRV